MQPRGSRLLHCAIVTLMRLVGITPLWWRFKRLPLAQTNVCTGVMERVGEPARSDEEEAERLVTSRCSSSTLFCNSARLASSSLYRW